METPSKISAISFAKETIKHIFNPNQKYHYWGNDNKLPIDILSLYDSIPEHSSAIDFTETNIIGDGINTDVINFWDAKKVVLDYIIFGGFTLQVIKLRGGGYTISYVDVSKCRFSTNKEQIAYSDNWDEYNPKVTWFPVTKDITKEGIYFFKNNKSREIYPRPYYLSSNTSLNTMKAIIDYHYNNAKNGFAPNVLINFNSGMPDDDTQNKIEKGISNKFTGETGQKFLLSFNESKDSATTIEKLDNDNLDQRFETLQKFIQNQIIISHKITSGTLIGVVPDNKGFAKTEYEEALAIFKEVIINGYRNELEYALNTLLKTTDIKFIDTKTGGLTDGTIN